jgi:hypothetical protein
MGSAREALRQRERAERSAKLASTYLGKTTAYLQGGTEIFESYMERLLGEALDAALVLVEALPDEPFVDYGVENGVKQWNLHESWHENAERLVAAIARRCENVGAEALIAKLENVEGRTPEEAKAFLAKAAELRKGRS